MNHSILKRFGVVVVGLASFVPLVHVVVIIVLILTNATTFLDRIIISLLVTAVFVWLPSVGYLIYRVIKSDTSESAKTAWTIGLVMWAPFMAPVAWYTFCLRRGGTRKP